LADEAPNNPIFIASNQRIAMLQGASWTSRLFEPLLSAQSETAKPDLKTDPFASIGLGILSVAGARRLSAIPALCTWDSPRK
jgi:hypothetical protein